MAQETRYCSECGRATPTDQLARFGDRLVCPVCKDTYTQRLREGVAPAVAVSYGGFWIRFVAVIIDGIILRVVSGIITMVTVGSFYTIPRFEPGDNPLMSLGSLMSMVGTASLISMTINCVYETLFISQLGATPGKMALGLKVVRPNGAPVSVGRAAGRYFAKILSALILFIGYIMAAFDSEKRALHDMICDTRVIRSRS
ncbi:MAG TPA: RDD family protein [Candidatus Limnocylindrales bacterium]|nr:RDD family protein [Candidatus Limnocylindrales bacterium]